MAALLTAAALLLQLNACLSTVGLAASPPMGFNNCNVRVALGLDNWTCCSGNQRLFEATAAALKANGLRQLGYRYINTDVRHPPRRDTSFGRTEATLHAKLASAPMMDPIPFDSFCFQLLIPAAWFRGSHEPRRGVAGRMAG